MTEKYIKKIGKKADDKDQAIRDNSLNTCGAIYKHIGEQLFDILGKTITEKAQDLLRKRFKSLGILREETLQPPTQNAQSRKMKSPMGRNNLNSSIGGGNKLGVPERGKIRSTVTPRKNSQFGLKSALQGSNQKPQQVAPPVPVQEPADLSPEQEEMIENEP